MKQDKLTRDPRQINALALAYMGDAVLEVRVRQHLIAAGEVKPNLLQRAAVRYVSAKAQASIVEGIWERLTEEEKAVLKRGRNAKSATVPKNANIAEYRLSTGFEALLGFLYLTRQEKRLDEILSYALEWVDSGLAAPTKE
ncbi:MULTISPECIES: Mini-ribonuclease 3 [Aneurinibacillus]|jgi:ribonuclease-3 family protein|uniref:Mini-ribonuclease 3 n=1 Tax=Aneurinibacillus thermoaerophilus TaxID=143495 RepID=A0A1G8CVG6_ANETH|nr:MULTISPECIES: Mini-ribonuclease 3 [Aneurinibacillus]AMA74472.1 ribonuclease III [Aneurinibacillus sp. XH2]MED0677295.1 Mini-ribonuclease 3 [Aneurinibacillus thermoaerophilus]MED0679059.1 Mini-ribonuclease 3 [Aneurinibacillus thermoaerophilus]MED0738728.1 Mini-ribonuclease 3 [Aneurinibacillus thermoaerophilus]MED0757829.1 Mini-ribonuclease 3 [Aneurinibacillus thermoaerophilus]